MNKLAFLLSICPATVHADLCDYRPSNLIGGIGSGALLATGGGTAALGIGAKTAGFYTLTHAVTGATMLGSTGGGVSAAGTVGIIGGTGGGIGAIASFIMAPATILVGAVIGGGIAVYEGGCYFVVERLDDPKIILDIVNNLADNADPNFLRLEQKDGEHFLLIAKSHDVQGQATEWDRYEVSNLYIEGGMLKHRDWGPNSQIGKVGIVTGSRSE